MKNNGFLIKSDNALIAETMGRHTLTELCRKLKLPMEIGPALPWDGEWHHVSAYANEVPYYNLGRVEAWLQTEPGRKALEKAKAEQKAKKDSTLEVVVAVAKVTWTAYYTDWIRGQARRGAAYTKTEDAVEVRFHPRKVMATIVRPDGSCFRKAADGFDMVGPDGDRIRSVNPLSTAGCRLHPGAEFTMPKTRVQAAIRSRSPSSRCRLPRMARPASRAAR